MTIYKLLKDRKTVTVRNTQGRVFAFQPVEELGIVMGYSVVDNGVVVPAHRRKMFQGEQSFGWMTADLTIVSAE